MKKRFLSMLLAVLMVLTLLPVSAFAEGELSGKCGDNVTWKLEDDTLTISGTGPIYDYYVNTVPWKPYSDSVVKIVIEEGVTRTGDNTFTQMRNLTSVSLPQSLEIISSSFRHCISLTAINIPDGVWRISSSAFRECRSLKEVNIPSSCTVIDAYAFDECMALESIVIPEGVLSISSAAFRNCSSLTNVYLPDSITSLADEAFYGCISLKTIKIPNSITLIDEFAFKFCTALESIVIPEGITIINNYAFEWCTSLKEIYLPQSLCELCTSAFDYCESLESIYYGGSIRQWREQVKISYRDVEQESYKHGYGQAVIYIGDESDPFKDVKKGDPFYDEIFWAYGNSIINGDGTGNYNPNDGITRAQIVMILWNATGNEEASKPSGFADVKDGAWYAKAVAWAVENGITNGTDLGFEPDRVCTRAEIVTFLHRVNNEPAPTAATSFTDLTQDWYKDAVAWAVENGITKGVGGNRFAPNDTCTRGQAAAFIYRLAQLAK